LPGVVPSSLAQGIAVRWTKDPRVVELVLRESRRIVRAERGVLICETRHGFICANAGADCSNVGRERAALLPLDPDASARRIRRDIKQWVGVEVGVLISDTFGRPWRAGQTDVAIGVAGLRAIRRDRWVADGATRSTATAIVDEIAGAAELVVGKLGRAPVALVHGLNEPAADGSSTQLVRPSENDLFR
jgi:coenzyme F420-0:L-glutamate ligase / coenzyme F420-1:gamma-L-glutamate ligase